MFPSKSLMVNKLSDRFSRLYNSNKLPWIIICIGIILRLVRYLNNPSFNFDEVQTAIDILNRSFSDLIHPSPDEVSTYPFVFHILTKIAVQLFGNTEYSFRIFPMLYGILSLFLFYYVAENYISPKAVPASLLLFAILDSPVLYSSILKPYSGDVFFALLVYASLFYYQSKNYTPLRTSLFAILGAIIILFSNASVFVLAGVGTSLVLFRLIEKEWSKIGHISTVCLTWALSFIVYYFVVIKNIMTNIDVGVEEILTREQALFPFPPKSLSDVRWFIDTFFDTFNFMDFLDFPHGLTLTGIAALLFLAGCISMYAKDKERFFTLVSPVLFTLAAAALHKYPFRGRLILFLTPLFLLIIAEGINYIYEETRNNSRVIIATIVILLFIYPVSWAANHVKKPLSQGGIKPVLQHIKDNWQDGDILYVHFYAQYEFDYYSKYHLKPSGFADDDYIIGIAPRGWYRLWKKQHASKYYDTKVTVTQSNTDKLKEYTKDLNKLLGRKRAWILFVGNISSTKGINDNDFFLYYLDTKGERLDSFKNEELSSVYLYNLGNQYTIKE